MYSRDKGGTKGCCCLGLCLRNAAEVHTDVSSETESSQSFRFEGIHKTLLVKGGTLATPPLVRCFFLLLFVDERDGQETTVSKNWGFFSTPGTSSISYRTRILVMLMDRCFCSRADRRVVLFVLMLLLLAFPFSSGRVWKDALSLCLSTTALL
jgi:hypothetical protein